MHSRAETMASIPVQPPMGTPTMLGTIEEKNVTFLVDTSGSMYSFLPMVKEHLVEALLTRAFKEKGTMFNVVQFSSTVTPWADKMVKCTPQTVVVAGDWLKKLECSTGTNTLDALVVAFSDPVCEAVYLITDGLPDQGPDAILREAAKVGQGRPAHCVYLARADADTPALDFLESLAVQTAGTLHVVSLTQHGDVERVGKVVRADHAGRRITNPVYTTRVPSSLGGGPRPFAVGGRHEADPNATAREEATRGMASPELGKPVKLCSVRTSVDHNPYGRDEMWTQPTAFTSPSKVVQYPGAVWEACRPPRPVRRLVTHASPLVADRGLIQGMRVVAKRDCDGYYCPAILTDEIVPQRTVLVTFDRDPKGPTVQQETGLCDVIAYNDAMRHTITPGDKVLTPWEKEAYRMAPGIVLEGIEGRSAGCAADTDFLVVSLFHGKTEKVPKQRAIWIPGDLYERVKLEIQMPLTARRFLDGGPARYPAYRSGLETYETLSSLGHRRDFPAYHDEYAFLARGVNQSVVAGDAINALIPGTGMTKGELHDKVTRQLAENSVPRTGDSLKYRSIPGRGQGDAERRVCFEEGLEDDSMGDSGVSLEKTEDDAKSDSGCEEDRLLDTGVQTVSLVDAGCMTDSMVLRGGISGRKKPREQDTWRYWKQTTPQPRRSKVQVGPFRETSLGAPVEARAQPQHAEPADYAGSSSQSTSFNDRDDVKTDNAQREWQHRQPLPPNLACRQVDYPPARKERAAYHARPSAARPATINGQDDPRADDARGEWQYRQPLPPKLARHRIDDPTPGSIRPAAYQTRPSSAGPSYFKSKQEQGDPACFAYESVGPPNRSANFERVDRSSSVISDRAKLEWLLQDPRPPPAPQGPGRPVGAAVGARDMAREAQERAMMGRRRLEASGREAKRKGKEYDTLRMKEAREVRNRKLTADVIQRESERQAKNEQRIEWSHKAKRAVSAGIRTQEETREVKGRDKQTMRIQASNQRQRRREELQARRNQEIEDARTRRQEVKEQRNSDRSQRHSAALAEQRAQGASRDGQKRTAQLERIDRHHQREAVGQAMKDLRIAVRAQQLQEYRSQVLP